MKKVLEVREYDSIIGNKDYKNDAQYKYLEKKIFDELISFVHEYQVEEEQADVLDFMKVGFKRQVGDVITVKNYSGLIQMKSGYQIQVLPKILVDQDDENNTKVKKIFLKMLRSMKDFPSKVFSDASLNVSRMNLYEIFINMYLQEVRQLIKHGLKSSYNRQEDNLAFYKGKLMVSEHIRNNTVHRERFYVSYDEYKVDRAENRIIKSTLLKLQNLTSSNENKKEIFQLLTSFEMVEKSTNYVKDFSKVKSDRSTKDYKLLMQWSRVFLMNKSFTTFSGDTSSRALLFPMEKLFESYVAKYIKKVFIPEGWRVSTQDKGYYLFDLPRKQFALRPDIVLSKSGCQIIMDTKWKNLINNSKKNYGISQSDMYQMYAYAKKYKTSEIWMLYPLNEEMKAHEDICFECNEEIEKIKVHLYLIDLENIENSIVGLLNAVELNLE